MYFCELRKARKGIATITAIFMLLLMFTALTGLLVAFFSYNLSAKEQMDIEHERCREKIELTALEVDEQFNISNVVINNTGTIEVRIRALYEIVNGETKFLFDPSNYADTQIAPTSSLVIYFPGGIPEIPFDPDAKIVAATERGTKTLDYVPTLLYGPVEPPSEYDPTKLYIGPLMLKFDDFSYHKTDGHGNLDPNESWQPGWIVPPSKGNTGYAWKISVMNIDNRNITIYRFASFNLIPTEAPSSTASWYLNPAEPNADKQFIEINQTESVMYIWTLPLSGDARKLTFPSGTTCMVFLTFFGVFHEIDGTETPYAQTIPFEAAVTVAG
jgi:hypothetical protein